MWHCPYRVRANASQKRYRPDAGDAKADRKGAAVTPNRSSRPIRRIVVMAALLAIAAGGGFYWLRHNGCGPRVGGAAGADPGQRGRRPAGRTCRSM